MLGAEWRPNGRVRAILAPPWRLLTALGQIVGAASVIAPALQKALRYNRPMLSRSAIESALRHLAPRIPSHEFAAVVDHAMDSPGLRVGSPENAAWLSLVAYARHTMTDYDDLLAQGYDQDSARFFVADELQEILAAWGVRRTLTSEQ